MKIRLTPITPFQSMIASGVSQGYVKSVTSNGDTGAVDVELTITLAPAQLTAVGNKTGMKVEVLDA